MMRNEKLDQWLEKHEAHCMWQTRTDPEREDSSVVEAWAIRSGKSVLAPICIVVRYTNGGWDLFTNSSQMLVTETLADAEMRLGL